MADALTRDQDYKGGLIWLQNQLLFDADLSHGHSGALIKRRRDNAAAALICARTAHHGFAVANPLFLIDWDVKSPKQDELPQVTLRRPVPREVEVWKVPQPELPCADSEPRQLTPEERRLDAIARLEWLQAKP